MDEHIVIGNDSVINLTTIMEGYRDMFYIYDQPLNIILITVYIPLFLVALVSNVLIILVVSRYRSLRSVTNYFLVNLAVADILVTIICMPVAVAQAVHQLWLFGDILCKLTHYLQAVAVSASVFTLTAMSLDRYLAIRHPMSRKFINRRNTRRVIAGLWLVALVMFSPILMIRKVDGFSINDESYNYCVEVWDDQVSKKVFGTFCFVLVYAIPGFIVVVEYELNQGNPSPPNNPSGSGNPQNLSLNSNNNVTWQVSSAGGRHVRERKRVAKILLILALLFALCWLPYSVLSLILDLTTHPIFGGEITTALLPFTILLGHFNSAINPLIFTILSKNFRRSLSEMVRHPTRAGRGHQHCKIRMNFRKEPPVSQDKGSNSNNSTNRPRNHHAPDPPPPPPNIPSDTEHGSLRGFGLGLNLGNPQNSPRCLNVNINNGKSCTVTFKDLCIVELKKRNHNNNHSSTPRSGNIECSQTPSSSGYSSLRHSTDTLTNGYYVKHEIPSTSGASNSCSVYTHSSMYPYFNDGSNQNPTIKSLPLTRRTSNSPSPPKLSNGHCSKIILNSEALKLDVPSTICEETEGTTTSLKSTTSTIEFKDVVVTIV